ncbi:MAG: TonB-dependent receptor [Cytophagales bacterium]|nr:TonB-dependent receptor [Cytophagales bacterium]
MKKTITSKLISMSRITLILAVINCLSLSLLMANSSSAQRRSIHDIKISLEIDGQLEKVLKTIEKSTDFRFSYNDDRLDKRRWVKVAGSNISVAELLTQIASQAQVNFRRINENIVVFEGRAKAKPVIEELSGSQEKIIKGRVTDENGEPLPGATVAVKETTIGTVTDADGNYTLSSPDDAETLIVSFIGYVSEEIPLNGRSVIDVILYPDITSLQEIIVVGYGTQKKTDITGSITVVDTDEMNKQIDQNVQSLLQGRVAGLVINPSSGAPGAGVSVNIRGSSSANAGSGPLYVIDGVQVGGGSRNSVGGTDQAINPTSSPLSLLNPQDIESIQVLKDASATAIYGARGANGVIIITTKKGKYSQKNQVNVSSYVGVQNLHAKMDLMNGRQHAEYLNDFLTATGNTPAFTESEIAALGEGTDWQNEITRRGTEALIQNHQLSLSGGNDRTTYYLSGSFFDQKGIVLNTGITRYTFRSNIEFDITDRLKLTTAMTFSSTDNQTGSDNSGSNNVRSAIQKGYATSPTIDVVDSDGEFIRDWVNSDKPENPVEALEDLDSKFITENFLGNFGLEWNILEGLNLQASVGVDISNSNGEFYYPSVSTFLGGLTSGRGDLTQNKFNSIINEYTLSYSRIFGDHSLNVLVGSSIQKSKTVTARTTALGFPNDIFRLNAIRQAAGGTTSFSNLSEKSLAGFLGRVNYDYKGLYLLTASIRRDGASVFGPNRKWGTFGSFSAGWRLSNESFMENVTFVDDLKLRIGYGETGNQEIAPYQSFAAVGGGGQYIIDGVVYTGTRPIRLANDDLGWELTKMTNFGLDFGFFENRLYGAMDYFDKTTEDQLLAVELDATNGVESRKLFNTGSITNKGLELLIGGTPVKNQNFTWNTELNVTIINNEVKSNGAGASRFYGNFSPAITGATAKIDSVGLPFGTFYGYQVEGVWNNQSEIDQAGAAGFDTTGISPGDIRILDANGDLSISADDRLILGDPYADFLFGFNNVFSYKGFSLTIFLRGAQGFEVINGASAEIFNPADGTTNKHRDLLNRWTPDNTESNIPRAGARGVVSDAPLSTYVEDGSFVKIQNVQLSYEFRNLPKWLYNATVYLSGQNLATFTDYSGVDPSLISADGVDRGAYPTATTYMLGVNLGF